MRASEPPGSAGGGGAAQQTDGLWLLIGNSRWHWAAGCSASLRCWSQPSSEASDESSASATPTVTPALTAWAAVGALPVARGPGGLTLHGAARVTLDHVPLANAPPWLGVDRALVGWQAWRCSEAPVLVADAGTALSLTRVDASGRFAGGRILAGAALQWKALAAGTAALPALLPHGAERPIGSSEAADPWPTATVAAMREGVLAGLAAAVQAAWLEARQHEPRCELHVTGGDGAALARRLGVACDPHLALRALAALRPVPDR